MGYKDNKNLSEGRCYLIVSKLGGTPNVHYLITRYHFTNTFDKFYFSLDRCGLEIGDIITHINGVPIKEASELYSLSGSDSLITLDVMKQGKKTKLTLDLSAPQSVPQ